MTTIRKHIAMAAAGAAMLCSACVNDLDTLPLNPSDTTSETVYGAEELGYVQGLAQIYFIFVSNDLTDLNPMDGGASELNRAFWTIQEVTSDACKCAWENDSWVRDMNTNGWSDADNDATYAVYVRSLQGVGFVNEYLRQTADGKLSDRGVDDALRQKIQSFRAEARFLRAYFYWISMDVFGNIPFTTEESPFGVEPPHQVKRTDVFNFLVTELEALAADDSAMPAARSNYPRADKGSVLGLLARLYLNAEVYTGTPRWDDAAKTCERIFDLGYSLCSDYEALFRGDNGTNPEAINEMLFAIPYHAEQTYSYGGTTYLTLAAVAADEGKGPNDEAYLDEGGNVLHCSALNGVNNGWAGIRVPGKYVEDYFAPTNVDNVTGTYTIADKRGRNIFYIRGRELSMENGLYNFKSGWTCFKFNNTPHDMTPYEYRETALLKAYSDVDMPLIRLAEIYLIYAEACLNGSYGAARALPYLSELGERAGVTAPTSYDKEWLMGERARELMWEGHRRTDLIRYGVFTSNSYLWSWKGGIYTGQSFPDYKTVFALPSSELASNPYLTQTDGYAKSE